MGDNYHFNARRVQIMDRRQFLTAGVMATVAGCSSSPPEPADQPFHPAEEVVELQSHDFYVREDGEFVLEGVIENISDETLDRTTLTCNLYIDDFRAARQGTQNEQVDPNIQTEHTIDFFDLPPDRINELTSYKLIIGYSTDKYDIDYEIANEYTTYSESYQFGASFVIPESDEA
jgi:hypothetical protein